MKKKKKLTHKQVKRILVKQYKSIIRGDVPRTGRYDPIIDFVSSVGNWRPL